MDERDLLNAPHAYAWLQHLRAQRVDVSAGTTVYAILGEFAHIEAAKASEIAKELQRAHPIAIEVKTSEEAQRLIDMVRSKERETIKALADALEKHARQVPCPGCGGIGSQTCATCDHGERPTHHPDVVAALRLAGR